jgi:diguanylate cyclase (GGDEF)-like protein
MDDTSKAHVHRLEDAYVSPFRYGRGAARFRSAALRTTAPFPIARGAKADQSALAGLNTLTHIAEIVRRLIRRPRGSHHALALVCLNLDELRLVCEAYGREESDRVIKIVTSELKAELGPRAVIARAGRGKFIVVLTGLTGAADAVKPVQRILDAIARPRRVGGQDLRITASAGIAAFPQHGDDYDSLRRNANAAMHESRSARPGGLRFPSRNVALHAKRHLRLRMDLSRAIENGELSLHYQPQFEVHTGRVCGVEVLARWFRLNGDSIQPCVFIPLAEQTGLISALGAWVLRDACKTVAAWYVPGEVPPTLCVNVSMQQIDENMCAVIRMAVESSGLPAEQLELEITESSLMKHPQSVLKCLAQCKELGVRIAIDDFGTGYSSYSHLSRMPVDRLKLDQSLIHNLTIQAKDAAIVRSVIGLGKDLGVSVIAEGVETEQQFQLLQDLGCLQVQGYLLARPRPPQEARSIMMNRWGMRPFPKEAFDRVSNDAT